MSSSKTSSLDTIKFLVENKADINLKDKNNNIGYTALYLAIMWVDDFSTPEVAKYLIDNGGYFQQK